MSKQIRNVIISLVVVLLLVGALVLIKFMPADESHGDEGVTTTQAVTQTPEDVTTPPDEGIYLTKDESNNLDYIEVTSDKGTFKVMQPQKSIWLVEGYEDMLTSDSLSYLVDSAANFKCAAIVKENCEDMSIYGLDKPVVTVRSVFRDGSEMTVYFGDPAPDSDAKSRYLYVKNGKTVYLEAVGLYSSFYHSIEDMFSPEVISPLYSSDPDSESKYETIDSIVLGGKARGTVIKMSANANYGTQKSGNQLMTNSRLIITEPINAAVDTETSGKFGTTYSKLTENGITAASVAAVHPTEEVLAKYGLVDPAYTLEFTAGGKTYKFSFSEYDAAEEVYYGTNENAMAVYRFNLTSAQWLVTGVEGLAAQNFYDGNLLQVSNITVTSGKDTKSFDIAHPNESSYTVSCGGKDVPVGNMTAFFSSICKLTWFEKAPSIPPITDSTTELKIVIKYNSDLGFAPDTITFTKSSARRYLVAVNGKGYFSCDETTLNKLIELYNSISD